MAAKTIRRLMGLTTALAAIGAATTVSAQDYRPGYGQAEMSVHAGSVEVPLNKSQVITADRTIDRALIGNEEIADIFPISDRSVYVLGKAMGTTSLTLYDRQNRVLAVVDVAVGPDVISLRDQIGSMMPNEQVDARLTNGKIVMSGTASSVGAADRMVQLARAYAGEENVVNLMTLGTSQQIMLEVRFAEVNRQVGKDIGISALFTNGSDFQGVIGNGAGFTSDGLRLSEITDSFAIINGVFDVAGLTIDAALDALEERGLSKTLAEPTLVSLSGEKASFLAGGEFPIPVVQSGSGGAANGDGGNAITIEFKPFGVSLGFTPTLIGNDVINLLVEPEVSSIDEAASISVGSLRIPGLQTRRASTVVELRDGESFAIAGLIQSDFATTVNQVPILGSIPILGSLFRSSSFQKGETELLIVVTPRLVQPIRPDQVQLPTERVTDPVQADVILNGTGYRPYDNAAGQRPTRDGPVRFDPAAPPPDYAADASLDNRLNDATRGESEYEY
ncbi:type II and III secretion system protein family protein [Altererythrobacter aurantiacus]|uniref:Type II and III secretion system protein family protein n=1 Tax=Parapontixanthobacter aurantiacus TaxID=1463599 RepID=A0A844ZBS9_9SPHN|nr:type II and III secretion system protein family protein [Parapontixanthobacter aurantiacus]MXO86001.1 type II and III secretion system protein family protein [Parapontixanthobacter aurantiacus]